MNTTTSEAGGCVHSFIYLFGGTQSLGQSRKLGNAQPLTADVSGETAGENDLLQLLLGELSAEGSAQTVDQCLTPLGESGFDHLNEMVRIVHHIRGGTRSQPQYGRGHLGRGDKAGVWHVKQQLALGVILAIDGERTVI